MKFEFLPNKGIVIEDKNITLSFGMTEQDEAILLKGEEYLWEKTFLHYPQKKVVEETNNVFPNIGNINLRYTNNKLTFITVKPDNILIWNNINLLETNYLKTIDLLKQNDFVCIDMYKGNTGLEKSNYFTFPDLNMALLCKNNKLQAVNIFNTHYLENKKLNEQYYAKMNRDKDNIIIKYTNKPKL